MKKVSTKQYAVIDLLIKTLTKLQNDLKADIKGGAELTFKDYADITETFCNRSSWSKEVQKELDEYAKSKGYTKEVTTYSRLDINNINADAQDIVNEIIEMLNNSNDKVVTKIASKIVNMK